MKLTDDQKAIVEKKDGKCIVLASAGSGKTFTLTQRIVRLLYKGVAPEAITAVSFTRKASEELHKRTINCSENARDCNFSTFHSMCLKVLKEYATHLANLKLITDPEFTVIDESESSSLADKSIEELYPNLSIKTAVSNFMAYWSRKTEWPNDYEAMTRIADEEVLAVYKHILQHKREQSYVDFDDLLKYTYLLFTSRPDVLHNVSQRIEHFIVDESQDLNDIQFELVNLFSSVNGNFMLIGDDLQSIYTFRGATVENFIRLSQSDTEIETLRLEQNFRSTQTIVKASNRLIQSNKNQLPKSSFSKNSSHILINLLTTRDKFLEAVKIRKLIQQSLSDGTTPEEVAVLFRSRRAAIDLEKELIINRIPYHLLGGHHFFDKPLVRQVWYLSRLIRNPIDETALENTLLFIEEVDEEMVQLLKKLSKEEDVSLSELLYTPVPYRHLPGQAGNKIKLFRSKVFDCIAELSEEHNDHGTIHEKLLHIISILKRYPRKKSSIKHDELDDLTEILILSSEKENLPPSATLHDVMNGMSQAYYTDKVDHDKRVILSTIHSSKGLEFEQVFIIGLEKDSFPSYYALSEQDVAEERRMMYVGMTRAKVKLLLSCVEMKSIKYGEVSVEPSPFINEIPSEYITRID